MSHDGPARSSHVLLPVLPLAEGCLFPGCTLDLEVSAPHALKALDLAARTGGRVLVVAQREEADATFRDVFAVGTVAELAAQEPAGGDARRVDLSGQERARCLEVLGTDLLVAECARLPEEGAGEEWTAVVEPLARFLHGHARLRAFLEERRRSGEPMAWINLVCQHLPIRLATRQQLLEADDAERCQRIGRVLEALLKKEHAS